ncbi:MAG: hypothetical protein ACTSQJ_07185 [Promethearchaeota archaeon]
MARSIKELGDTQRCKKCGEFGKIVAQKVSLKTVKILYICNKCIKNFSHDYTIEEYVSMGNGFLIDDEKWIFDFQRKYMISNQEFIQIKNGIDGAFFVKNKTAVRNFGKNLICKCGDFYKMEFKFHKKGKLFFNLLCEKCGKKKFNIKEKDFFELGHAGIIPTSLITLVKDELETDAMEWDAEEAYATPGTILSADARSRLGMDDDYFEEIEGLTCEKCGAAINLEMKKFGKCPTCGAPLK